MSWFERNNKSIKLTATFLSNVLTSPPIHMHTFYPNEEARTQNDSDTNRERDASIIFDMITQSVDGSWTDSGSGQSKAPHGVLWQGDFHQGKQLLQSLSRRIKKDSLPSTMSITERFLANRQTVIDTNRFLSHVLIQFEADYRLDLSRAPPLREACEAAFGSFETVTAGTAPVASTATTATPAVSIKGDRHHVRSLAEPRVLLIVPLREVVGAVGAYEWRRRGVLVPALGPGARIHPHFSVFAPSSRQEYIHLMAEVRVKLQSLFGASALSHQLSLPLCQ